MLAVAAATALVATLAQGVSAVPCSVPCYYMMTTEMDWTPESHPTDFPMDLSDDFPHFEGFFSPFWTVSHDDSFTMWRNGELSNPGIREIAELGSGMAFLREVEACGSQSCGEPEGIPCEPMGGTCTASSMVKVSMMYPYISTGAMLVPSPDWFTGVANMNMCVDGEWLDTYERMMFAYDSGTDSGETFLSENELTSPPEPISRFGADDTGIFFNPEQGTTLPVGNIYLDLVCDGMVEGIYGTYGSYGM